MAAASLMSTNRPHSPLRTDVIENSISDYISLINLAQGTWALSSGGRTQPQTCSYRVCKSRRKWATLGERHVTSGVSRSVQFTQSVGNSSTKRELHFVSVDHGLANCRLDELCGVEAQVTKKKSENSVESGRVLRFPGSFMSRFIVSIIKNFTCTVFPSAHVV